MWKSPGHSSSPCWKWSDGVWRIRGSLWYPCVASVMWVLQSIKNAWVTQVCQTSFPKCLGTWISSALYVCSSVPYACMCECTSNVLTLGTTQVFELHLLMSCLLAQSCASMTVPAIGREFVFAQRPLNPALHRALQESYANIRVLQVNFKSILSDLPWCPSWKGNQGTPRHPVPVRNSNCIRNWGVSGLGFAAAML